MDAITIYSLTVEQLKEKLVELQLSTSGLKAELQTRLLDYYQLLPAINNNNNQVDNSNMSEAGSEAETIRANANVNNSRPVFTLRDVEDSVSHFTGSDTTDVNRWITELEEIAQTVGWTDLQIFIYAKQLIKSAAKLFVRGLNNIYSWDDLKCALVEEFGRKLSSAEVHRALRNRKKQNKESLIEYLYSLIELGNSSASRVDEVSIIEYFVEGIPDSRMNKTILYEAQNIKELKEKIRIYGKVKGSFVSQNKVAEHGNRFTTREVDKEKVDQKKCFKCGRDGHLIKDCKSEVVCFKCNGKGHYSYQCKSNAKVKQEHVNAIGDEESGRVGMMFVGVNCHQVSFKALFDSGSRHSLLDWDIYKKVSAKVKLDNEKLRLTGVGQGLVTTLGSFMAKINVEGVTLTIKFHVVGRGNIPYSALLGVDILKQVDVNIIEGKLMFISKEAKQNSTAELVKGSFDIKMQKEKRQHLVDSSSAYEVLKEFEGLCCSVLTNEGDKIELDTNHLKPSVKREIERMVEEYVPQKCVQTPVKMKIVVTDDIPVYQHPRRTSWTDSQIIRDQVNCWLEEGIIVPSCSEYASPVVLVSKKDGTKRLCCDFRAVNMKIVRDNFPMTVIDEVLERLQGAKVFSTLDLRNGFFHVPIEEDSRKYTAFVTNEGQFEFNYAPFGISNSPAVFCRFIRTIFQSLLNEGIMVVYMDDIVVIAQDESEGISRLKRVLAVASANGLQIKWEKCQFLKQKINFLGYIIEDGSILPSVCKTIAITDFPVPRNKKELQRFLGLASYFRRFVENFALIAKPLTDLLKQDAVFKMKEEHLLAFEQLKTALIQAPSLKLYNPLAQTEVHTDASKYGYGGVLLQKDSVDQQFHPVEFMSRKTNGAEEKYSSYELEVLAVIKALQKWRIYLKDVKFKIVTDCNAFVSSVKNKNAPDRVMRWAMYLQQFDYCIEHRSGTRMRHVDALSRVYCLLVEDSLKFKLQEAQKQDEWLRAISKVLEKDAYDDFFLKNGLIYKDPVHELLVVPSSMEEELIKIAHNEGHFGVKRTQQIIEQRYFIPCLNEKVARVVRGCIECIVMNAKSGKKEGLLTSIVKSDKPLGTYHLDHVGPLTETRKLYNYILVVVDGFSKFVWLYPTKSIGVDEVLGRLTKQADIFGNPHRVITDRGAAFTSNAFKEYCMEQNIQHLLIATGVPRGNGQVERMHQVVVPTIAKMSHNKPDQWYKYVGRVQQIINSTPTRSTGHAPFKILTGLDMKRKDFPDLRELLVNAEVLDLEASREQSRVEARENILKIQAENQKTFNKNRKIETQYSVGALVAIKKTQFGVCSKLRPRYLGPYRVTAKLPHGRYEVEKVGQQDGPLKTSTVAEYMKAWQ